MSVIESSPYYVTNTVENILTFSSIGGAVCVGTDLFITDTGNDTIIKYDISGYVNNDKALANKRNLIEIVGGRGQARDNLLFNSPTLLTTDDKHVILYDSNNFIIKVLDTDLNFITRISSVNLRTEQFLTFEYNRLTGLLYILTQSTTGIKVYVLDEKFNIADIYTLQLTLESLEVINNIVFSLSDSNYFYLCTNFSIYKLLVNRPDIIIGRFDSSRFYTSARSSDTFANSLWNYVNITFNEAAYIWNADNTDFAAGASSSIFNDTFKGIRLTSQSTNSDKLFFISSSRIYYFNEQHNLSTVLKEPNFENFGNTLTLDKSEYIQTSTINKELYKVVRDIIELKNNIVGRFTGYYDDRNVFTYTDYNYNINLTEIYSQLPSNYYIHDNEKNILGVLNRTITEIYTLQEQLIKLTTADLGEELAPILNYGTTQISNVLIIE